MLRNNPDERRCHLRLGASLNSRKMRRYLNGVDVYARQLVVYFYSFKIS